MLQSHSFIWSQRIVIQVASTTWLKHFISLENATQQDILEKGDDSYGIIVSDENGDFDINLFKYKHKYKMVVLP